MENAGVCACPMCECSATEENPYCSDHCRDIVEQDMTEIKCDCGHSGCS